MSCILIILIIVAPTTGPGPVTFSWSQVSTVQHQNIHSLLFVSFSPVSVLPGAVSARANFTPEFMGNKARVIGAACCCCSICLTLIDWRAQTTREARHQ